MFRNLARLIPAPPELGAAGPATQVFRVHPFQLSRWLEEAWIAARTAPEFGVRTTTALPFLGSDQIIDALDLPAPSAASVLPPFPSGINAADVGTFNGAVFTSATVPLVWDHLSYAYLIECTGVFEVMAEVVRRFAVGETLNTLSADGTRWVRATEELFYRDPPLFAISGIASEARPDLRVTRRNNYWRMFGMEPPHPVPGRWRRYGYVEQSWRADTGEGVNAGFREKWTELLRQVWLGFENARNGIGPNATDREYVAFLCQSLRDMMTMRRRGGQLAREEFVHVTTMSWFHLTLETDTPIVVDLKAEATNAADRLAKIAASGRHVAGCPGPRAVRAGRPDVVAAPGDRARAVRSGRGRRDAVPADRRQRGSGSRHEPDHRPLAVRHRRPGQGPAGPAGAGAGAAGAASCRGRRALRAGVRGRAS